MNGNNQHKGQRKSLFIGKRAPLIEDGNPLLYARYTQVSEILLGSKAQPKEKSQPAPQQSRAATHPHQAVAQPSPVASARPNAQTALLARSAAAQKSATQSQPAEAATEAVSPAAADAAAAAKPKRDKPREKKKKRSAEDAAAGDGGDAAADAEEEANRLKKQKKEQRKAEKAAKKAAQHDGSKQTSGPANADEAASIRAVLGFASPTAAAPAVVAAPAAVPAMGGFSFGFQPSAVAAAPAAAPAAESSDEDSSGDEAVPVQTPQPSGNAPATAAAPASARTPAKLEPPPAVPGQPYVPRRVFVGGMPFSYEEEAIREYWGYCGEIEELSIVRFPDTGRFKGMVFITFTDEEGFQKALDSHGAELDGQTLRVAALQKLCLSQIISLQLRMPCCRDYEQVDRCKASKNKKGSESTPQRHHTAEPEKVPGYWVAYCGNIDFDATVEDVRSVFEDCGVTTVRLHTDKETGRSKGYAHVHFPDEASLDRAVAKSGTSLYGRGLKVGYAQKKNP